jgi:undecaprenyl-diphosphatase
MHDILMSIVLGVIEGVTEFLPVSSTGHLLVAERLLGLSDNWQAFTVVIQLGAILAVVAIYFQKFWTVLVTLPTSAEARRFAGGVVLAFLPAAVAGVLLGHQINTLLLNPTVAMPVIAISWVAGGLMILLLERIAPAARFMSGDQLPLGKAFQIGLCQIMALLPGVSRSGATILGGELLGVERSAATVFTFYLAVPTMLGATVLDVYKNRDALAGAAWTDIGVGSVVAFLVALVVVKGFIGFISRYGLAPFGWYRIGAGLCLFAWIALR